MKNILAKRIRYTLAVMSFAALCLAGIAQTNNIIDEVAWVVGDEPIYKSEIEEMYQQAQYENQQFPGNPYCVIPEQIAVEKLYLHQAKLDTIEAPEAAVQQNVDQRINYYIANLGSKEKVEAQFRKPMHQIREQLVELYRNTFIMQQVQQSLTKDVKATPADVRKFFAQLPSDSVPYVPMQVEAQIITINPTVTQQEIDDVKARLREYSEKVNSGEAQFSTLAFFYSEDKGSATRGGELGFHGKADFVPEFSNVAFNLNDPKKVSRIVETEFGYHIIQLIEKRGEQINCRHILLRPKVNDAEIDTAVVHLDSLRSNILAGKISFENAARLVSQDKDTRNNKGIMMNAQTQSNRFEMQDLPQDIARVIDKLKPGEISEPIIMMDEKKNKEVVALVKLTARIDAHKANLSDDYNMLKNLYENVKKENILKDWVERKIKETHVKIEDGWGGCEFQYQGWIK